MPTFTATLGGPTHCVWAEDINQSTLLSSEGSTHSRVGKSAHSAAWLLGLAQLHHVCTGQGELTAAQGLYLSKQNHNRIYIDVWLNDLIMKSAQRNKE